MKSLLDLLNEVEEKQIEKPIKEEGPSVVDEIGKFFVVKKPGKGMTKEALKNKKESAREKIKALQ